MYTSKKVVDCSNIHYNKLRLTGSIILHPRTPSGWIQAACETFCRKCNKNSIDIYFHKYINIYIKTQHKAQSFVRRSLHRIHLQGAAGGSWRGGGSLQQQHHGQTAEAECGLSSYKDCLNVIGDWTSQLMNQWGLNNIFCFLNIGLFLEDSSVRVWEIIPYQKQ